MRDVPDENETGSPRAARFARRSLVAVAVLCALYLAFAFQLHRSPGMKLLPALLGLICLAGLRGALKLQLNIVLVVLPGLITLHAFSAYMTYLKPPPAVVAARAGRGFDTRTKWEAVIDLRAQGEKATAAVQPKSVLLELDGLTLGGARTLPLGGISSVRSVYCNESGAYSIFDADEHGFNNPKGLWSGDPTEIAVLGDSYTQGACVPPETSFPSRLRQKHPRTLNLGMGGNGPLLELAGIREYLSVMKPRTVLWAYFRNDMPDLDVEKKDRLLIHYLEPGFRQGLVDEQPQIDAALTAMIEDKGPQAGKWPDFFGSIGLTRRRAPFLLEDLVMGESSSSLSSILRLDPIDLLVASHAAAGPFQPDFPLFERILTRAREEVAAWGGQLYFVYIADMYALGKRYKLHPLRDRVLGAARNAGVPIIDTSPAFEALIDIDAVRYNPTSHCNPAGYELLAKVIDEALPAPH